MSKKTTTTVVEKFNDDGKITERTTTTIVEEDNNPIIDFTYPPYTPPTILKDPPEYTIPNITCGSITGDKQAVDIINNNQIKTDCYSTKNV